MKGTLILLKMLILFAASTHAGFAVNLAFLVQDIKLDQPGYALGKPVIITYAIRNTGNEPLRFDFASAKQFDVWIMLGNQEIWRLSRGRVYAAVGTVITLNQSETMIFEATWDQKTDGGARVGPGPYVVYVQLTSGNVKPDTIWTVARLGAGAGMMMVPASIGEVIKYADKFIGRQVRITARYMGHQPDPQSRMIKPGPPVSVNDFGICDGRQCIYVTGKNNLDPVKDVGNRVNVLGVVTRNEKGQVYIALENMTLVTPSNPASPFPEFPVF